LVEYKKLKNTQHQEKESKLIDKISMKYQWQKQEGKKG